MTEEDCFEDVFAWILMASWGHLAFFEGVLGATFASLFHSGPRTRDIPAKCASPIRLRLDFNENWWFHEGESIMCFENAGFTRASAPVFGAEGGDDPRRVLLLVRVGFFTCSRKGVPAPRRERIFRKWAERPRCKLKSSRARLVSLERCSQAIST